MANPYKKVYLHIVFAVKHRHALLGKDWRDKVFAYIAGILNKRGHYSLAVNGYNDHVHIFFDYSCKELISDLVREIKKASNQYIVENIFTKNKFEWQNGYAVFSVGYRDKEIILNYIVNQEAHPTSRTFKEEYISLMTKYEVDYEEEYIFEFFDTFNES